MCSNILLSLRSCVRVSFPVYPSPRGMGRRDTPGNLRLLTPQSKSCQITGEPKAYEEAKLRHNNVILPEGVGVAVALIAPLLPAQSGKSCRSNIGTPYVFIQIKSTITAKRFIPKPAFA